MRDEGFSLPQTSIQVVNLDQPGDAISENLKNSMPAFAETEEDNIEKISSMGDLMVSILEFRGFSTNCGITIAQDIDSARSAVDRQEAGWQWLSQKISQKRYFRCRVRLCSNL